MDPNNDLLIQLAPAILIGLIYAVVVFVVARRRHVSPWPWTIAALIPVFGMIVSAVFLFLSFISVLDRLNALEAAAGVRAEG